MAGVADEVLVAPAASPDHKRKIQDLEAEAPETTPAVEEGDPEVATAASESPDSKRPRLDDNVEVSGDCLRFTPHYQCMLLFQYLPGHGRSDFDVVMKKSMIKCII